MAPRPKRLEVSGCSSTRDATYFSPKMPSPSEASTSRSASPAPSHEEEIDTEHAGGPETGSPAPSNDVDEAQESAFSASTFESLGVIAPLLTALEQLKFTKPTEIQAEAIPYALQGRDIIGVAKTVSDRLSVAAEFNHLQLINLL